jgi:hypothetical protein
MKIDIFHLVRGMEVIMARFQVAFTLADLIFQKRSKFVYFLSVVFIASFSFSISVLANGQFQNVSVLNKPVCSDNF